VQTFGGVFARSEYRFGSVSSLDASARLDFWSLREGERVERSPASGALLRSDRFANRDGLEPSVGLALRHPLAETLTLTAAAGSSFRLPTINELYRPFRVRNDITEANPGLEPERFLSLDAGARWTPEDDFSLELNLFHNWIGNAIANVPIGDPGEAMAIAGFVPPGGTVAQRRNVEEARAWGLEARARWQPSPLCAFTLTYLFSRSEFTDSPDQPLLEGKRFPQAPAHRLVAGLESNPLESLGLLAQVDFGSGQYDDALEVRHLPSWWSVRLGAELTLSEGFSVHARVENLFDQEITTGLGSSGLRSIGVPRSFWMDVRYQF
jgi:outer membrane receptor protein involved in Fe transport